MKFDTRAPCSTCPYRKDVPAGYWHRSEFDRLAKADADPARGAVFGCHKGKRAKPEKMQVCGGWLLDQKKRGVPNISLRLDMLKNREAVEAMAKITSGGAPMYASIADMCAANGIGVKSPRKRPMTLKQVLRRLRGVKS